MTASDPAVAAAQRSLDAAFKVANPSPPLRGLLSEVAEAAAREALGPIRDLHKILTEGHSDQREDFSRGVMHAMQFLAELIYPEAKP